MTLTSRRPKPTPEEEIQMKNLWIQYQDEPSESLRNRLMEHYLPLVKYNAERVHTKLPQEVDVDDLMSAGIFGLMDAIDAFDLERGVKFETYCAPRIRGAILDELRAMDWVPRLVRSRSSIVDKASKRFKKETGPRPHRRGAAGAARGGQRRVRQDQEGRRRDRRGVAQPQMVRDRLEQGRPRDRHLPGPPPGRPPPTGAEEGPAGGDYKGPHPAPSG